MQNNIESLLKDDKKLKKAFDEIESLVIILKQIDYGINPYKYQKNNVPPTLKSVGL